VVLVVDARKFNFEGLEHGLAEIRAAGANVVGIVLNRVRRRKGAPVYGYEAAGDPAVSGSENLKVKPRRLARSG